MNKKVTLTAQQHTLRNKHFSEGVIDIVLTLQKHNFEAYIVGGAVRDLLLGISPKDFDVATSATPEQISKIFKRSRIIGRRFKIVHVMSHYEKIEVTTFRTSHEKHELKKAVNSQGLLISDNKYGSLEEDAQRRDFSVNALYYDPKQCTIIDYCGGLTAIENSQLRIIGDPQIRFREDPVRMLRALRLQSKLPLTLDSDTLRVLKQNTALLQQVSAARLFDEMLKLFMNGYALACFENLKDMALLQQLIPCAAYHFEKTPVATSLYIHALKNSDARIKQGKKITPSFLLAVFLWPEVQSKQLQIQKVNSDLNDYESFQHAIFNTIDQQAIITSIPKRFQTMMREIWQLQRRLQNNLQDNKRSKNILAHPRFRAAFDFLLVREAACEIDKGAADWWQAFQLQHADILEKSRQLQAKKYKQRFNKTRRSRK